MSKLIEYFVAGLNTERDLAEAEAALAARKRELVSNTGAVSSTAVTATPVAAAPNKPRRYVEGAAEPVPAPAAKPALEVVAPPLFDTKALLGVALAVTKPRVPSLPVGKAVVYLDTHENGGAWSSMTMPTGEVREFQGLFKMVLPGNITIKIAHDQDVRPGLNYLVAILNGEQITGEITRSTPNGVTPGWTATKGGAPGMGHAFRRLRQGGPLEIITLKGTYAVITELTFEESYDPYRDDSAG